MQTPKRSPAMPSTPGRWLITCRTGSVCKVSVMWITADDVSLVQGNMTTTVSALQCRLLTDCMYSGDWRLAAQLSSPSSLRPPCCCICAVLSPHTQEHDSLDSLVAATEAAWQRRADGKAQPGERIWLHLATAEAHRRAADMATAQWHSYEALRLSVRSPTTVSSQSWMQTGDHAHDSAHGGGWHAAALRLAALLQGGQLCEAAGSPEEALDAFKQARKLVRSCPAGTRLEPIVADGSLSKPGCFGVSMPGPALSRPCPFA